MEQNQLIAIVLVLGLAIGGGAGYMLAPKEVVSENGDSTTVTVDKIPISGTTVQLGRIADGAGSLETVTPLTHELIEPDINAYYEKLGYDVEIEFLIDEGGGQAAVHLEKVQGFRSMDISTFIGGGYSSMAQAALSYCNENDMLMWSPSSTSPLLALGDDNLFRLCPTDALQAPAMAEMLWSYGIEAVLVIATGDAYGDGVYNIFESEYNERGGVVIERIRYAVESTEFSNYLATGNDLVKPYIEEYGQEHVGVILVASSGATTMVTQAPDFPELYGLVWFGTDGTSLSQTLIDDAGEQSTHLKVLSTNASPGSSAKYNKLDAEYRALVGQQPGYYVTTAYDISWILAQAVVDTQSSVGIDLIPTMDDICYNYWGTSGWCRINEDGDRYGSDYLIWGYGPNAEGVTDNICYGVYKTTSGEVTWYADVLGYIPPGHD